MRNWEKCSTFYSIFTHLLCFAMRFVCLFIHLNEYLWTKLQSSIRWICIAHLENGKTVYTVQWYSFELIYRTKSKRKWYDICGDTIYIWQIFDLNSHSCSERVCSVRMDGVAFVWRDWYNHDVQAFQGIHWILLKSTSHEDDNLPNNP